MVVTEVILDFQASYSSCSCGDHWLHPMKVSMFSIPPILEGVTIYLDTKDIISFKNAFKDHIDVENILHKKSCYKILTCDCRHTEIVNV